MTVPTNPHAKVTDLATHRAKKEAAKLFTFDSPFFILEGRTPKRATSVGWERWFEKNHDNNRVALTEIGGVNVSTVFLGIDYNFGMGGPPKLFETIVFGGALDRECVRYSTYEQAEEGHIDVVSRVRAAERKTR